MIPFLFLSLLKELLRLLKAHPGFMSLDTDQRRLVFSSHLPAPLPQYMAEGNDRQLLSDIRLAVQTLRDGEAYRGDKGGLVRAFCEFLALGLGDVLDQLRKDFYLMDQRERQATLMKTLGFKGSFGDALTDLIVSESFQEVNAEVTDFLRRTLGASTVVVQSPTPLSTDLKKEIRKSYAQLHKDSFVEFSITPQLIGGLRVFVDGKVEDRSWYGEVQRIATLHI